MFRFLCLGSGSSGNCYYLESNNKAILIDAGIGIRQFKKAAKEYGINISYIMGILITHDHADHIKAVGYLSGEYCLPVYTTALIHEGIRRNYRTHKMINPASVRFVEKDKAFNVADMTIMPFDIPHDSTENIGYSISTNDVNDGVFTIMTDVGKPTSNIEEYVGKSNFIVIEANYDAEMLRNGKYPKMLQDRIRGGNGHMSNSQTAQVLAENFHEKIRNVFLCHLSEENNHPELARKTIEFHLRKYGIIAGKDFELEVLKRRVPTGFFELKL